jgi:hypothetical protein
MPFPAVGILSFLAVWLGRWGTYEVVKWLAIKSLIITIGFVVVPIVADRVIYHLLTKSLTVAGQIAGGVNGVDPLAVSGFTGWLFSCLKVPQCMAVFCGALATRIGLRLTPYMGAALGS